MKIIWSVVSGLFLCFVLWLGGYDFNERGVEAALTAVLTAMLMAFVYFWPGWTDKHHE